MGESEGKPQLHLAREKGSEREHRDERVDSTLKEGDFQEEKERQAKGTSLREAGESRSGPKSSPGGWPNLKWKRRLRDKEPTHKKTKRNESV